jgi:Zn-dependent protease with chaperone function
MIESIKNFLLPITTEKISALTALVAVFVGPFISLFIARREIRSSVVSANRQVWINSLREKIAEFVKIVNAIKVAKKTKAEDDNWLIDETNRAIFLELNIELMLNPEEDDHNALLADLVYVLVELAGSDSEESLANLQDGSERILKKTKPILKREWKRVKKGK